jgi:hypothetical protein
MTSTDCPSGKPGLDIGHQIPIAAPEHLDGVGDQSRIEQRAVATEADDAVELESRAGREETGQDIVERPAVAVNSGVGAEFGDGIVGGLARCRHRDEVEGCAAPQAIEKMREDGLAAERPQHLAGQALRVEARLDDRTDPHRRRV